MPLTLVGVIAQSNTAPCTNVTGGALHAAGSEMTVRWSSTYGNDGGGVTGIDDPSGEGSNLEVDARFVSASAPGISPSEMAHR